MDERDDISGQRSRFAWAAVLGTMGALAATSATVCVIGYCHLGWSIINAGVLALVLALVFVCIQIFGLKFPHFEDIQTQMSAMLGLMLLAVAWIFCVASILIDTFFFFPLSRTIFICALIHLAITVIVGRKNEKIRKFLEILKKRKNT